MVNVKQLLIGEFNFNEWSSYQSIPEVFSAKLDEFGSFRIYEDFKHFVEDNDIYLEDKDGNLSNLYNIMLSEDAFNRFTIKNMNMSLFYGIKYSQINDAFIHAQVHDTTEPKDYFLIVKNIKKEEELISFVNHVLSDNGQVTHSSGIRNKYEITNFIG